MVEYLKIYLVSLVIFLGVDFFWLGFIARKLYRNQIGFLLKETFSMGVALIFYVIFVAGLIFFVINKAVEINSWQYALFAGMFYGFITYSTYDLTNLSTIKDWPIFLTVVDILWGTVLCGLTSFLSYLFIIKFNL